MAIKLDDGDIREQIRGSDLYSPMVKRAMERFWKALDAVKAAKNQSEQLELKRN